jgi:hypothetical protein
MTRRVSVWRSSRRRKIGNDRDRRCRRARDSLDTVTQVASHEMVDAATDRFTRSSPAYHAPLRRGAEVDVAVGVRHPVSWPAAAI